jgi:hypothetical protein
VAAFQVFRRGRIGVFADRSIGPPGGRQIILEIVIERVAMLEDDSRVFGDLEPMLTVACQPYLDLFDYRSLEVFVHRGEFDFNPRGNRRR